MISAKRFFGLQANIMLLVSCVVALSLLITVLLVSRNVEKTSLQYQGEKAMNIARTVAHTPLVIEELSGQQGSLEIQRFANDIKRVTNVEFVVVMDMHGIRKSHPDPKKIGHRFTGGDEGSVFQGLEHISFARGTLGESLRAFAPVVASDGKQIGAVAVGISLDKVEQAVQQSRSKVYIGIGIGALVGAIGALLLAKRIKKILFGLEPSVIAKLLEERSAMLQSVREGILAIDQHGNITLVNTEAARMFARAALPDEVLGKNINGYLPMLRLPAVVESGEGELDQELVLNGISLLVNSLPIYVNGNIVGAIATFRDKTELNQLAEQLTGVRLYAEALRAQSHEFMNKMHVILGMVHLGYYDQLSAYIKQITNHHQNEIGTINRKIENPILAGFILGKLSYAREAGVELNVAAENQLPEPSDPQVLHELITIIGNLVDNAIEAVLECYDKRIDVHFRYEAGVLILKVSDTGPGISSELQNEIVNNGVSTKGKNRGVGLYLVQGSLRRWNGNMQISSQLGMGTTFTVYFPFKSKGEWA